MKKTSTEELANATLPRTTRAFEHGNDAFGARTIKPGFALTAEDDLLFALGWPHVRYVIDGHPADLVTDPAAIEKAVFRSQVGLDVPRGIAMRRIRAFAAFANGPDGKLRQGAVRALQNDARMSEDEAKAFVLEHLSGRSLGVQQLEIAFLLEAIAGPNAIAEAITTAFENAADAQLLDHAAEKSTWAFALGFLLLRASADVSIGLRQRLEAIMSRCPREDVNSHSVANVLDQVLHTSKASLRSDHTEQSLLLHWVGEAEAVRAELDPKRRPFCGALYARMVFVGGEEVIDYYKKHYDKVREAPVQRAIVAEFGRIASPRIRELIAAMSEKSKAEDEAHAWLDRNRPSYR